MELWSLMIISLITLSYCSQHGIHRSWSYLDVALHVLHLATILAFTLGLLKLGQLLDQLRVRSLHLRQLYIFLLIILSGENIVPSPYTPAWTRPYY